MFCFLEDVSGYEVLVCGGNVLSLLFVGVDFFNGVVYKMLVFGMELILFCVFEELCWFGGVVYLNCLLCLF